MKTGSPGHSILLLPPDRIVPPFSWVGHIPFAMLLVRLAKPRLLVELGTHSGNSFNAFCQAVVHCGLPTRCVAVDTWAGDPHAGHYGPEILEDLRSYQHGRYDRFAALRQTSFDLARDEFEDGSIDLLHIDGLHTYEAVRHDFGHWLPKLSPRAIVLLHDTAVRRDDFGVWRFWQEASARYPSLGFSHCNGLGVLAVGTTPPPRVLRLIKAEQAGAGGLRRLCARLGDALVAEHNLATMRMALDETSARLATSVEYGETLSGRLQLAERDVDKLTDGLRRQRRGYEAQIGNLERQLHEWRRQAEAGGNALTALQSSHSWRLTHPLRVSATAARRGALRLSGYYRLLPESFRGRLRPVLRPLRQRLLEPASAPAAAAPTIAHYREAAARLALAPPERIDFIAGEDPLFAIVLAASGADSARRCLAALLPQCAGDAGELIVCGDRSCLDALGHSLTGARLSHCTDADLARVFAHGAALTHFERVLCVSDVCVPLPGFVEELQRADGDGAGLPVAARLVTDTGRLIYPREAEDALAPEHCFARRIDTAFPPACLARRALLSGDVTAPLAARYQPLAEALWTGAAAKPTPAHDAETGPRLLVLDLLTPTPDRDSGSVDAFFQMRLAIELGFRVTFLPVADLAWMPRYTADLQRLGVECLYRPHETSVAAHLHEAGPRYDAVLISRLATAEQWMDLVRHECRHARVLFNTVDLHFVREARQAEVEKDALLAVQAERTRTAEMRAMHRADATLAISAAETDLLRREAPEIRCFHLPLIMAIDGRIDTPFEQRRDMFFIGGYKHRPNVDAVVHFVRQVWPAIAARLPDARFHIVGSDPPPEVQALAGGRVSVSGFVPDAAPFFNECRLSLAPLRYGAGLKGKVGRSFGYGCPVVASSLAVEGMALAEDEGALVADDDAAFVDATVRAYADPALWRRLSAGGSSYFETHFSLTAGRNRMADIFAEMGVLPR